MNYEKKYKEALELARVAAFNGHQSLMEGIFPELKESEDEKIRKALMRFVEAFPYDRLENDGVSVKDAIAWLEKQGEQKPIIEMKSAEESLGISSEEYNDIVNDCLYGESNSSDKKEPKFKAGDWIVYKDIVWKVCNISLLNYYELLKINNEVSTRRIEDVDKNARLWTIQDANDGNVICSNQIIVLFKQWEDNTDYNFVIAHAGIDISGKLQITNGHWLINNNTHPATKEQRDFLFQKMKEDGYEWDADKKELKKIEQMKEVDLESEITLWANAIPEIRLDDVERLATYFFELGLKVQKGGMIEALRTEYEKGRADVIAKTLEWINVFNDNNYIMQYSDSCEHPINEIIEWYKNYINRE